MSDNVTMYPGSTGTPFPVSTDDVGGVHVQIVKPAFGGDGVATQVSLTTPMPVASVLNTASIDNAGTLLTPKFAAISASSSGNNTLVAAVTGKKIRVLAYNLIGNGAVNIKFQSGAGGTDLTGLKYIAAAGGGLCAPFNPVGWFETASNTLLNLNLSGAIAVGGELVYIEV